MLTVTQPIGPKTVIITATPSRLRQNFYDSAAAATFSSHKYLKRPSSISPPLSMTSSSLASPPTSSSCGEDFVEDIGDFDFIDHFMPPPRKRERLTHLTLEEKNFRRKMKNRIAAQTARDRKKSFMMDLEVRIKRLQAENEALKNENGKLLKNAHSLSEENSLLKTESVANVQNTSFIAVSAGSSSQLPPASERVKHEITNEQHDHVTTTTPVGHESAERTDRLVHTLGGASAAAAVAVGSAERTDDRGCSSSAPILDVVGDSGRAPAHHFGGDDEQLLEYIREFFESELADQPQQQSDSIKIEKRDGTEDCLDRKQKFEQQQGDVVEPKVERVVTAVQGDAVENGGGIMKTSFDHQYHHLAQNDVGPPAPHVAYFDNDISAPLSEAPQNFSLLNRSSTLSLSNDSNFASNSSLSGLSVPGSPCSLVDIVLGGGSSLASEEFPFFDGDFFEQAFKDVVVPPNFIDDHEKFDNNNNENATLLNNNEKIVGASTFINDSSLPLFLQDDFLFSNNNNNSSNVNTYLNEIMRISDFL